MSKLITRMTSFKSGGARAQRPVSYTPPTSRHTTEPTEDLQKPQHLQQEQTVQVEIAPKDTTATSTPAKEDSVPPNIVVKEPTPEPPEQEGTPPRNGIPLHEGSSPQASKSGSKQVDENHVASYPQAEEPHPQVGGPHPQVEEPHPQVERTESKPHPLQATHSAPRGCEPRDEPAVHVEEGQREEDTAEDTTVAATTAVESREEVAGLREKDTTVATPLSTEDTTQRVEEHAASPAGKKVAEGVPAKPEPPPAANALAASHSPAKPSAVSPSKRSPETPTKPSAVSPSKPGAGVKKFLLQSELPTVPTAPTLPAEVREYLSRKFAADAIKEHLAAVSSEGEEPPDLPLPPMYRSFSFSSDHEDDIAPSMNEMRLFLANCA